MRRLTSGSSAEQGVLRQLTQVLSPREDPPLQEASCHVTWSKHLTTPLFPKHPIDPKEIPAESDDPKGVLGMSSQMPLPPGVVDGLLGVVTADSGHWPRLLILTGLLALR